MAVVKEFRTAADYWSGMVEPDYLDCMNNPADLRAAFHAAISLFHMHDWVWKTHEAAVQAIFTFTAATGSNLQTTTLTVAIDTLFTQYFSSPGSAATGSQFIFTQPFTVTGSTQAIVSVSVTLVNKIGQSTAATATLN